MAEAAPPRPKMTVKERLSELIERTNDSMRRMRVIEERLDTLNNRMNTVEETGLEMKRDADESIKKLSARMSEESERLVKAEAAIRDMVAQLKKSVTITQLKELEHLLDIYNPLKSNFVTREEAEKLIEDRLGRKQV